MPTENKVCKCEVCGEVFETYQTLNSHIKKQHHLSSKEYYDKYFKKPGEGFCLCCGKPVIFRCITIGYPQFCSSKCSHTPPFNPFSRKNFKNHKQEHDRKKFGCDYSTQNEEVKQKILSGKYKHSSDFLNQKLQLDNSHITIVEHNKTNLYTLHCSVCNKDFELGHSFIYNRISRHQNVCPICCPTETIMSSSIFEKQMVSEIKKIYKGTVKTNDRTAIKPKELDAYLPELNLAFEFDGLYFHADPRLFKPDDKIAKRGNKTAKEIWEYDSQKNIDCQENGITLVRIKELDWKQNKQAEINKIYKYIIEYTKKEVKND